MMNIDVGYIFRELSTIPENKQRIGKDIIDTESHIAALNTKMNRIENDLLVNISKAIINDEKRADHGKPKYKSDAIRTAQVEKTRWFNDDWKKYRKKKHELLETLSGLKLDMQYENDKKSCVKYIIGALKVGLNPEDIIEDEDVITEEELADFRKQYEITANMEEKDMKDRIGRVFENLCDERHLTPGNMTNEETAAVWKEAEQKVNDAMTGAE